MIHYELVGSHPSMNLINLELTIEKFVALARKHGRTHEDELVMTFRRAEIELAAEHFYGLRGQDFVSTLALIDAIKSAEESMRVA